MEIAILDTVRNEKVMFEDKHWEGDIWYWTEGGGSCDCNRSIKFSDEVDDEMDREMRGRFPDLEDDQTCCYGANRFLIVKVDPMPESYELLDFNRSYPEELLMKYGIM